MPVGLRDQRILLRKMVIDESDRDSRLRADAPHGQSIVTVAFQTLDRRVDERLTALLRQLTLKAGFARIHFCSARANQAARRNRRRLKSERISRAALCPGAPVTPPPG